MYLKLLLGELWRLTIFAVGVDVKGILHWVANSGKRFIRSFTDIVQQYLARWIARNARNLARNCWNTVPSKFWATSHLPRIHADPPVMTWHLEKLPSVGIEPTTPSYLGKYSTTELWGTYKVSSSIGESHSTFPCQAASYTIEHCSEDNLVVRQRFSRPSLVSMGVIWSCYWVNCGG